MLTKLFNSLMELNLMPNPVIDGNGTIRWYNDVGQYHRLDDPAVVWSDGCKEWWLNGKPHRLDGPAVIFADGTKAWFLNGRRHREDGPAVEGFTGYKSWYLNGKEYTEDAYRTIQFFNGVNVNG
jgi:hypothetical protein